MTYSFVETTLNSGSKILKPILPEEYECFAIMLLIDVHYDDERYTEALESVVSGKTNEAVLSGNSGCLTIRRETSCFEGFYDEDSKEYSISTAELYQLVVDWKIALNRFIKEV